MPQFNITGPDGQKYRITAPEGATEEQAQELLGRQLAPENTRSTGGNLLAGLEEGLAGPVVGLGQIAENMVPPVARAVKREFPGLAKTARYVKEETTRPTSSTAEEIGRGLGGAAPAVLMGGGGLLPLALKALLAGAMQPTQSGSLQSHGVGALEGVATGSVLPGAGAAVSKLASLPYFGHALRHLAAATMGGGIAHLLPTGHLAAAFGGWPLYFALRNSPLAHLAERAGVGATRGTGKLLKKASEISTAPIAAETAKLHGEYLDRLEPASKKDLEGPSASQQ